MLRAALCGCGKIGSEFVQDAGRIGIYTHAQAYDVLDGVFLSAICDPSVEKRRACAERYQLDQAQQYADLNEMLRHEQIDLLSIATPDALHASQAVLALSTNSLQGVLLEKPLAQTLEEAKLLIDAMSQSDTLVSVNYSRRFCPAHQRVKYAIDSAQFGKVQAVSGVYGKGIRHNGTHWLDLIRWFFGEVDQLSALPSLASEYQGDPSPNIQLKMASDLLISLRALDHHAYSLFEMDIFFENGRIRLTEGGHRIEWYGVAASPFYTGYKTPTLLELDQTGCQNTLLAAVQNLCAAVRGGEVLKCTAIDGYLALKLADAAIQSMQQGGVWLPIRP